MLDLAKLQAKIISWIQTIFKQKKERNLANFQAKKTS